MADVDEGGGAEDVEAILIDTDVFIELMAGGDRAAPCFRLWPGAMDSSRS